MGCCGWPHRRECTGRPAPARQSLSLGRQQRLYCASSWLRLRRFGCCAAWRPSLGSSRPLVSRRVATCVIVQTGANAKLCANLETGAELLRTPLFERDPGSQSNICVAPNQIQRPCNQLGRAKRRRNAKLRDNKQVQAAGNVVGKAEDRKAQSCTLHRVSVGMHGSERLDERSWFTHVVLKVKSQNVLNTAETAPARTAAAGRLPNWCSSLTDLQRVLVQKPVLCGQRTTPQVGRYKLALHLADLQ